MKNRKLSEQEYVSSRGVRCPFCGAEDIEGDSRVEVDAGVATQEVHCNACGEDWEDVYQLIGTNIKPSAENDPAPMPDQANKEYTVAWEIQLDAQSAADAALKALEVQRDPNSTAHVFSVTDKSGCTVLLDLDAVT